MQKRQRIDQMNDITIRNFELKDSESVYEISKICFPLPWSLEAIKGEADNEFAHYVVAVCSGQVVGFGGMWILLDEADITNIAVHPDFQGQQVGSRIVEGLIKICISKNVSDITLEVRISNVVAQKLYKKYGFVEEGIRKKFYENNNEDAVIMWKRNVK